MNAISIFGQILSEKINLKLMPSKGVIRIAFVEANLDPNTSKYVHYKKVFEEYLKERLERIGIENTADIVEYMISELVRNQAVFTMGS